MTSSIDEPNSFETFTVPWLLGKIPGRFWRPMGIPLRRGFVRRGTTSVHAPEGHFFEPISRFPDVFPVPSRVHNLAWER